MTMKKYILSVLVFLIIGAVILAKSIFGCSLSDEEAISITKGFCNKIGITYSHDPLVTGSSYRWVSLNGKVKDVGFGEIGNWEASSSVSCCKKEVVYFNDSKIDRLVYKKYNIPSITTEPHNWPPFLSEKKAKEIISTIAEKIGLPPDAELYSLSLDDKNGYWNAYWKRKQNGFFYEMDNVFIAIMAVDGEFNRYSKFYWSEPCETTAIKISKEDAIAEGWKQAAKYYDQADWEKYKDAYKVESAELLIVQPNVLFGTAVYWWYSSKSRLAWVIDYRLKQPIKNRRHLHESILIKIDAVTKKYLGGDYAL